MGSWDDHRLSCIHGVREGLDNHDCYRCKEICKGEGHIHPSDNSCVWTKQPRKKKMKELLFVYGTLKKGHNNHRILERLGGKYIRNGRVKGFQMYKVAYFPGVVQGDGTIYGEVYEVDNMALERMDQFEGRPTLYDRIQVQVQLLERKKVVTANIYLYMKPVKPSTRINSGIFKRRKR